MAARLLAKDEGPPSLSLIMINVGRQDFATFQPIPPPSPARGEPEHPVTSAGSFQHRVGFTGTGVSGSSDI
jgi:hypothetical protein